ncbi:hypothetical protein CHH78_20300 [Shouchella clausii]|nr:hypothetical protein CHH76_16130 [Shouchella clausii]PAD12014.1 hypothetical protein CHH74_17805 [Shouchella clausii]PAE78597.1 hypothetical protein CHH78_20300 [Shouchella clausii]PAF03407.1 hypothetical protein CHH66_20145 [Shouchella clausii]PTL23301.1 hypothetical protein DA802_08535 [Shouchella clausii]
MLSNRAGESFIGKREQATQRRVAQIDQEINEAKKKITALESEKAVLQMPACMCLWQTIILSVAASVKK